MARTHHRAQNVVGERAQACRLGSVAPDTIVQSDVPKPVEKITPEPTQQVLITPTEHHAPTSRAVGEQAPPGPFGSVASATGLQPDLPGPVEKIPPETNGENATVTIDADNDTVECDHWCSGCSNGGRLVDCSFCKCRSVCDLCIPFPDPTILQSSVFMCPVCHMEKRKEQPYFAFWVNNSPATDKPTQIASLENRGWFSRLDSTAFAIISLRLATMSDQGFPPQAVYHHIQSYYGSQHPQNAFEIFDFPFAFTTKTAVANFKSDMIALSRHLKEHHFQRIIVFLSTHSDPERGDLHYSHGFACTADELFECLFPATLRKYLRNQDAILVLLACGAAVRNKLSFDSILGLATDGTFRATVGFCASQFQPPRANFFLTKLSEKYFFRRYTFDKALQASLSEEAGLGAHGDIIIISKDKNGQWIERTYIWSHIGSRPWGNDVTQQCPGCKRIRPWEKPKLVKRTIKHACRYCPYSRMFEKPVGMIHDGESGRGHWYFIPRVLQSSTA